MNKILHFLKYIIPFTLVLFGFHYLILKQFFEGRTFFYQPLSIYLFQFIATLLIYFFLLFINKNYSERTGFAFMGATLLKMLASIVFLIPLINSNQTETILNVSSFFIPYFLYLFFEAYFAIQLINKD